MKRFLKYLAYIAILLITVGGALQKKIDVTGYAEPGKSLLQFAIDWSVSLIIGSAVVLLITHVARDIIEGQIENRKQIKKTLDYLLDEFFQDVSSVDLFKYRVTLFKAYKFKNCLSTRGNNYLKVFARSGETHQISETILSIDNNYQKKNEGVAGQAWYKNCTYKVNITCEWEGCPEPEKSPRCKQYAEDGFLSVSTASKLVIKSMSFMATVVRNRQGEKWGVLVLDSQESQGISNTSEKEALVNLVAKLISYHI